MAMSCMIRKTSHGVVPLALRAMASPRILTGSVNANAPIGEEHGLNVHRSYQYFSTAPNAHKLADKEFREFLKSEIKSAKPLDSDIQLPQAPADFPFEIWKEIPGEAKIILSRKLDGEDILIEVDGPHNNTKDNNDDVTSDDSDNSSSTDTSDDDDDDDNVNSSSTDSSSDEEEEQVTEIGKFNFLEPRINLRVRISKEYKYTVKQLECLVWANNGSILVRDIHLESDERPVQFSGPSWILEGNRQDSWRDYLAARGIEGGFVDFLMEYMVKRNKRDNLIFLKKLNDFVKK